MTVILPQNRINHVQKGSRILVIPMSKLSGDRVTLLGYPCADGPGEPFEIRESFEAVFEDFDGENLRVWTPRFYCLRISLEEIKDIRILAPESKGCL